MSERLLLKMQRIDKGLKIKELAQLLGITSSYISMMERNKVNFPPALYRRYKQHIEDYTT